ncbi:hypothetical protein [uncultured Lamprocystis sp.]|jgi:hypothetical protein|uniref:hypothetical protein n=1 Tax=uncultured Lamprocystis sp. TaxID=543132 RepID=UPI0025F1215E|nr:hypothetical protein [uncultured Lamprocystis sp.]
MDTFTNAPAPRGRPGEPARNSDPSHDAAATQATSRDLAVATGHLNGAVNSHVVRLAKENGSTTTPAARFVHFNNATARAIGLPKSDATVIAALPIEDRAIPERPAKQHR